MPGLRRPGASPKKQKAQDLHIPVRGVECQGGAKEMFTERHPPDYVL